MSEHTYLPTIGLEIHAELKTQTKMFCASQNAPMSAMPNTHVCPICMGHPGTLPAVNKRAVEAVVMVGLALRGTIATYTEFDRKNYFYPDIPKGYQISQYAYPLVRGGALLDIAVTRVHLEEDTARSLHDQGAGSLIDYNRAGVPLMELVTEPVIHDAKTASDFARELQLLLRTLGVSNANMDEGQMRVEANISVGKAGVLGTKVEVKNLNSFRSVEMAIAYEVSRQIALLDGGGSVTQETRGWDEQKQLTFSQRKKESSHDYRYFPDPDIPKINLSVTDEISISRLTEIMPELPSELRLKYDYLGLPKNIADTLVSNIEAGKFFQKTARDLTDPELIRLTANYITTDLMSHMDLDKTLSLEHASSESFIDLMTLIGNNSITSRVAKDMLKEVVFEGKNAAVLVNERNLGAMPVEEIMKVVERVVSKHPDVVQEFKAGKVAVLQFLVGQCMKETKGAAAPDQLKRFLLERIG